MKKIIKNKNRYIVIVPLIIVIFIILKVIILKEMTIDTYIYDIFKNIDRNNLSNDFMIFISFLGSATFLIILSLIIFILYAKKRIGALIIVNLGISTLLNNILKLIILRPRPVDYNIIDIGGYSFPSGHSMVSAAYYGYIIYIIYTNLNNETLKKILCVSLLILILTIGFSRLYFGVHYFSDVISGFLISIIYLTFFIKKIHLKTQKQ